LGKAGFSRDRPAGGPREVTESGKRVYRKFDAPRERPTRTFSSDRPARPEGGGGFAARPGGDFAPRKFAGKPSGKPGGFAGKAGHKPGGGFAGKKPFGKSGAPFSGKPTSTFAKFANNKKPFGKKAPARKFKPSQGESA
jgi:hypothetical protein